MSNNADWAEGRVGRFRLDGNMGTPFHQRTAALATTNWYFNWDLRMVPDEFVDFTEEVRAIRENVAMGDMSPLTKAVIEGTQAAEAVDWLVTRDIGKMEVRQVLFAPLCTPEGKVVTDGLIFREGQNKFRITADPMINWVTENTKQFDVTVSDATDDYGILTLQGPKSREVLEAATGRDWSNLDFSRLEAAEIGGVEIEVGRTGFTGELGFELQVKREDANALWDAVAAAGKPFGIIPAGEYALDICRTEAGLMITGCDYTNAGPDPSGSHCKASRHPDRLASPYEIGLGGLVNLSKGDFIGREALAKEKAQGVQRKMLGININWRAVVDLYLEQGIAPLISPKVDWEGAQLFDGEIEIGWISSTVWSPTTKKLVAFAHVDAVHAEVGKNVNVAWKVKGGEDGRVPGTLVKLPHIELNRSSA